MRLDVYDRKTPIASVVWMAILALVTTWSLSLGGCDDKTDGSSVARASDERAAPAESRGERATDEGPAPKEPPTAGREQRAPTAGEDGDARNKPVALLALGDSYTSAVGVADAERWPMVLADRLRDAGIEVESPTIVATGGWTSRQLLEGLDRASLRARFDYVAVLIGTNDALSAWSPERLRENYRDILERAITLVGDRPSRVLALTLPDYGVTPVGRRAESESEEGGSGVRDVEVYNETIRTVADEVGASVVDIEPISDRIAADSDLLADALHPGPRIHELWAKKVAAAILDRDR